jgi:hypothetical protein
MSQPAEHLPPAEEPHAPHLEVVQTLTEEAWEEQGRALADGYRRRTDEALWAIGDWIAAAEQELDGSDKKKRTNRYTKAAEITGLGYGRLRNVACTARAFPMSRRRDTLTLAHHAVVQAKTAGERKQWLDRAEKQEWSEKDLRRKVSEKNMKRERPQKSKPLTYTVTVPKDQERRWVTAAKAKKLDMPSFIVAMVNLALAQQQGEAA